jgi:hypothetical protein
MILIDRIKEWDGHATPVRLREAPEALIARNQSLRKMSDLHGLPV